MGKEQRTTAGEIARIYLDAGDPLGWFDDLYAQANEDTSTCFYQVDDMAVIQGACHCGAVRG